MVVTGSYISSYTSNPASIQRLKQARAAAEIDGSGLKLAGVSQAECDVMNAGEARSSGVSEKTITWSKIAANLSAADGAIHIEDEVMLAQMAMDDLDQKMKMALANSSISPNPEITMKFLPNSNEIDFGNHPQKAEIKQLFEQNPELKRSAVEALHLKTTANIHQRHSLFQDLWSNAYDSKGKKAANDMFMRFMSMQEPVTSMVYGSNGIRSLCGTVSTEQALMQLEKALVSCNVLG